MGGNPENEQERRPVEETETQAGGPAGVDVANGRQSRSETSNDAGADAEQRADGEVASAPEEDELTRLRRETEELRDQWTRERAEFSNFRKRTIIEPPASQARNDQFLCWGVACRPGQLRSGLEHRERERGSEELHRWRADDTRQLHQYFAEAQH